MEDLIRRTIIIKKNQRMDGQIQSNQQRLQEALSENQEREYKTLEEEMKNTKGKFSFWDIQREKKREKCKSSDMGQSTPFCTFIHCLSFFFSVL